MTDFICWLIESNAISGKPYWVCVEHPLTLTDKAHEAIKFRLKEDAEFMRTTLTVFGGFKNLIVTEHLFNVEEPK